MYLQERNLALSSEGIKMTVASEQPHFIDILGTGVVIYHLQVTNCHIIQVKSNAIIMLCFFHRKGRPELDQAVAALKLT